jgi:hypothetical protein
MKLQKLDSFESLNSQELQYVVGGTYTMDSACWEDSTSQDSKKYDKGGCSKKHDEPAFAAH